MKLKQFYFALASLLLFSCGGDTTFVEDETVYFCGAENKVEGEWGGYVFETDNMDFKAGETQSDAFAFEGKYSIKLDAKNKYGMSFLLTDIAEGEYFEASVWQKETENPGALVCSATGNAVFSLTSLENGFYEFQDGWMKHIVRFKAITDLDSLTFFVFAGGEAEESYYDNFEVKRFANRPADSLSGDQLTIALPDSSKQKIDKYIRKSVKEEIIADKYKKYVDATLLVDNDSIPVEMRLKGDWTDHLISGNASYRIKTASGTAYKGLRSFSIQHPKTRNYMHEWFMHQLCDSEDILSTRYDFLQVRINENNQGVYALEEHFDKQLLESRNRREGPILKLDETGFWAQAIYAREMGMEKMTVPFYEASIISCFKENRTLKSETLFGQFKNGAILLTDFKNGYAYPELIFDIKRIATYYALMDLGNVNHSLAWHNRRFYYNPVTTKLEHIGFDMIPMVLPFNPTFATVEFSKKPEEVSPEGRLNHHLFLNEKFREVYIAQLKRFSSESYLDSTFNALDEEIKQFEGLMGAEIPNYSFERSLYYEKAKLIRSELNTLDQRWDEYISNAKGKVIRFGGDEPRYDMGNTAYFIEDISVNAFRTEIDSVHYLMQFENYHFDSVTIVGYALKKNKDSIIRFDKEIELAGFIGDGSPADTASLVLNQKPSRFFFKPANLPGEIAKKKFYKWSRPEGEHPRVSLFKKFSTSSPYYSCTGNVVRFRKGTYELNELLYIPDDYKVEFEAGTTIDFVNGGGLILNGTTHMMGTEEDSIKFTSSDGSGMGITILQADSVLVSCVEVANMNTLDYEGWKLTGAFSVYEAYVEIDGLWIHDNTCEDGLNVIRSDFQIKNCLIERTKSDGFDADFCTGTFLNSTFKNTGNDCIDFSGSNVSIADIIIENSGDKGVSAGERSQLYLTNIQIDGAITGLASKDDSRIEGDEITVKNAEVGMALFQKKPEYAGSTMLLLGVKFQNLGRLALIEEGSEAQVGEETYKGYCKFDIDQMYARFEKK